MDRPRPVPWPIGLVVKKGSKARASTSGRHARSGIGDGHGHVFAGRHVRRGRVLGTSRRSGEDGVRGLDEQVSAVGHGVARVDDKVEQRALELVRVAQGRPQLARQPSRRGWPGPPCGGTGPPCRRPAGSHRWAWGRASGGARRRAGGGSAPPRGWPTPAPPRCSAPSSAVRPWAARLRISSRLPEMPASRLLKSCASPPVSWPTASIFCDWRSASSTRSRSSASVRSLSFASVSSRVRSATFASSTSLARRSASSAAFRWGDIDGGAGVAERTPQPRARSSGRARGSNEPHRPDARGETPSYNSTAWQAHP